MTLPFQSDEAFYSPNADVSEKVEEGVYKAHIVGLDVSRDITIKGKYLADIYNPKFKIWENEERFAGQEVRGAGVFRFKKPSDDNPSLIDRKGGGNKQFKDFLESIGVPMKEVENEETGEKLYALPSVLLDDIYGKAVYIKVHHEKFISRRDDKEYTSAKARIEYSWSDGPDLAETDDLPF